MRLRTRVVSLILIGLLLVIILVGPLTLLFFVKPDLVVIEVERRGCFGICPIYSVRILGDGQVRYEGQRFVLVEGVQATRLTAWQVQELMAAFENIQFSTLPDQLSYGISDLEESRTCLTSWSTRKCVEIHSTYPAAGLIELPRVKDLNQLIEATAQVEQWVGTRAQIIEQLSQPSRPAN